VLGHGTEIHRAGNQPPEVAEPKPPAELPFEVYAWPKGLVESGRTVFFAATDAAPAFNRNLNGTYIGWKQPPGPGVGRVDKQDSSEGYLGRDQQRWLLSTLGK
jgi:hypothetical protein